MKCNVHGFPKGNQGLARVGGLIRKNNGLLIMGFGKNLRINSKKYVEGFAMWFGVKLLHDYGATNIEMGGSKIMIDILLNKVTFPWHI